MKGRKEDKIYAYIHVCWCIPVTLSEESWEEVTAVSVEGRSVARGAGLKEGILLWSQFPWWLCWLYIQLRAHFLFSITSIKRQETKRNKAETLQCVQTGLKAASIHSQTQGATYTVTLCINRSLLTRDLLWKKLNRESCMKHAESFLLQFICSFLLCERISYGQINNSEFLFLFQLVQEPLWCGVMCVCVCTHEFDCMIMWVWNMLINR